MIDGRVVKMNRASIDMETRTWTGEPIVRRYHKEQRNDDGTWSDAIGRPPVKAALCTAGRRRGCSIPRGLFDELWMLEYDTAPARTPTMTTWPTS